MNTVNRLAGTVMDVILTPLELLGPELAILLVSGLVGILGLLIFKQISWQKGIKDTKDQIKGDMIAIRLYQDDLAVVATSVGKILLRNVQYLCLNFLPILPILAPFALVLSQLVVRYGFDPLPVTPVEEVNTALAGAGQSLEIQFKDDRRSDAARLEVVFPEGIQPASKLVRNGFEGFASQEFFAVGPVNGVIELKVDGQVVGTKEIVAGTEPAKSMQPERVSGFWPAWLWPAEDTFGSDSPVATVAFEYPTRELRWLPGGPGGILLVFFIASIVFGAAILKPLNITI